MFLMFHVAAVSDASVLVVSGRLRVPLPSGRCGDLFRISEAVQPWDAPYADCLRPEPLASRLLRSVTALGRAPAIAFVGDSRARELHVRAVHASGQPQVPLPPRRPDRDICMDPGSSPQYQCRFGMCSQDVPGDVLTSRLQWRTQMNRHMSAALGEMADACVSRRPRHPRRPWERRHACPDTVVVNSGLWYTYRLDVYGGNRRERLVALYRWELWKLMPSLTRLARSTHTIWKLEEAMFSEFIHDKYLAANTKTEINALLMVQQAVVYDVAAAEVSASVGRGV